VHVQQFLFPACPVHCAAVQCGARGSSSTACMHSPTWTVNISHVASGILQLPVPFLGFTASLP
jgi:hypothetical protein